MYCFLADISDIKKYKPCNFHAIDGQVAHNASLDPARESLYKLSADVQRLLSIVLQQVFLHEMQTIW